MTGKDLARRVMAAIAPEEELGDLEELFGSAAETRYVREAAGIGLSILRRRLKRGGEDMVRLFLWAGFSVILIMFFLSAAGGESSVYIQPFEWCIILSAMLGFALAGRRLGSWRVILGDLRRADRLTGHSRRDRRADVVTRWREGAIAVPVEFAHLAEIARIAQAGRAEHLMSACILSFRERSRLKLKTVEQSVQDAYYGAAIAMVLGFIHMLGNLDEPLMVLGHLLGGSLCAPFFGIILGRAVLVPMGERLSCLYEQEAREMEALRLVAESPTGPDLTNELFEVLA